MKCKRFFVIMHNFSFFYYVSRYFNIKLREKEALYFTEIKGFLCPTISFPSGNHPIKQGRKKAQKHDG